MAKKTDNTLLILGAAAAGLYFLTSSSNTTPNVLPGATAALLPYGVPALSYSYLVSGAPAIPAVYDVIYYKTYIRPAMLIADSNINNPAYVLSDTDITNYLNNYLDLRQGLPTWVGKKTAGVTQTSLNMVAQTHWRIYGVAEQRTFLPLPWSSNVPYIPPPPTSSSGSGVFGTILKVATIAAGGIVTVATGGTAAPLVAAGESAALTAESAAFHGGPEQLSDTEIEMLVTSAAIIKKILPFYLQVNPQLVNSIENRLDSLIAKYAN